MTHHPTLEEVDSYLNARTGTFDQHAVRYRKAAETLKKVGLKDSETLVDAGAGWTELDYILRTELRWRGRYLPVDAGLTGDDLEEWTPVRRFDWFVCLETLEHLSDPERLLEEMVKWSVRGVICSVPNPETVEVLSIDETHLTTPGKSLFQKYDFTVTEELFFGGVYSKGAPDALFAVLLKN